MIFSGKVKTDDWYFGINCFDYSLYINICILFSQAIKKFAEEFEKRCIASGIYPVITKNILKNLVKEKTEE